ncbi:MAG: tetratricopeptide repeat protein [Chitinivibrionales bacterium]|nr:tetratricopeptide repeat protein [Chitinivibrionales bacterium]
MRVLGLVCVAVLFSRVFGDETFDKLFNAGKYSEALEYVDQKIPPTSRDAALWVKIAKANESQGLIEKALASFMVSWRMNPKDYESLFGAARIYNKMNQFDQAMVFAKKALDERFTAEASWEYAKACIAMKRPQEAKKALEKVIESDPSNVVANRELGIIYYNEKQYKEALPLLKKSYETQPDPYVAYQLGKCYGEAKDSEAAIQYLNKALDQKKNLYEAVLELSHAYFDKGMYKEATVEFEKIESIIQLNADDYFSQGVAYENIGKSAEAYRAFRTAITKFGRDGRSQALVARLKVGSADLAARKYADALGNLTFIAESDPKALIVNNIYFLLSEAYQGMGNSAKAIESLEKAIALSQSNIEAYARLADLYTQNKMAEKARITYEKMMALSPNDARVYMVLGDYNLKAKKYADAISLYEKGNSLSKSPIALEGIAVAAAALNLWDKAQDAAESAIRMDTSRLEARIVYTQGLLRENNFKDAKDHLEYLTRRMPSRLQYWIDLAQCYSKLNDSEKLAKVDRQIIKMDNNNVESRYRFAQYSQQKGDETSAYEVYKDLVGLKPNDVGVLKNLYQIALRKNDKANCLVYLKKYVTLNPKDAEAYKTLGDLSYDNKDLNGALVAYREALRIDPGITGFYKRYAEIVIAKGQQDEVIKALSGIVGSGEADFGTYSTLGMIYLKKGTFQKAMEMYQKALMLQPQNIDALFALGECQEKMGDITSAIITYEQAVMMNPNLSKEYKALGDLYMRQKKNDEAMRVYLKYLEKNPSDIEIAKQVGLYYYDKKDYQNAAKTLGAMQGKTALSLNVQYILADAYFNTQQYEKAAAILKELSNNRTLKADLRKQIFYMLAQSYEKVNKVNEAMDIYDLYMKFPNVFDPEIAYKRAFIREKTNPTVAKQLYQQNIRTYPNDYRNYLHLGQLYAKDNSTASNAVSLLEKAAAMSAKDQSVWLVIADIYYKLNMTEKALDAYRKYIEIDPKNVDANIKIGTILVDKGKINEGLVYLETANTFSPDNEAVLGALAKGYLQTNRTNEAISLLNKVKAKKPNDVEIRKNLYTAYLKVGDKKSAVDEINEVLKVKRNDTLLFLYAKLLFEEGKVKEAEGVIEDIKATNPENLNALMLLGKIFKSRKKYDEALEVYKEVIYIDANYAPALYERAEIYMLEDKPQWAERFYDRALRADPNYGLAELGKARLAKSRKDDAGYVEHLRNAVKLDPNNPEIKAEAEKAKL